MADFPKLDDRAIAVIDRLNARMKEVGRISEEFDWSALGPGGSIDKRDFKPMALLLDEPEGVTPEAKQADMDTKVREMEAAFNSGDTARKKPYLDKMYDLFDNFDMNAIDMSKDEDVKKLMAYAALGQTYGTKKDENREYFDARYATIDQKRILDASNRFSMAVTTVMMDQLRTTGRTLETQLSLPASMPGQEATGRMFYDFSRCEMERVQAMRDGREPEPIKLVVPASMKRYQILNKVDDAQWTGRSREMEDMKNEAYTRLLGAFANITIPGSEAGAITRESRTSSADLIFIDGKSLTEIQKERFPNAKAAAATDLQGLLLSQAMVSGKNRIEYAQFERNAQGEYDVSVHPLKLDVSAVQPPLKESIKEDYGWFRRTFLNWGPMRCKTRQEQQDALYARDPKQAERAEAIKKAVTERVIEPGIQAIAKQKSTQARERTNVKELSGPTREQTLQKTKVEEKTKTATMDKGRGGK